MSNTVLALQGVSKFFGTVIALQDVSFSLEKAEVHCLLGDNGAGKSTLIKILSGVHTPSTGKYIYEGKEMQMDSPRNALKMGVATVYQDLALVPLMSITRNFFMGREIYSSVVGIKVLDMPTMNEITHTQLKKIGIAIRSPAQAVGTMSGGERQSLAIARAVYFGAKVLILDEPTAALGVVQTVNVLKTVHQTKLAGVSVIFITHNVRHAMAVGDRFTVLNRGKTLEVCKRSGTHVTLDYLQNLMAGDKDLEDITAELGDTVANV